MAKRGRKPGTPKTGGRQPGSMNKITLEMRQWITDIVNDNKERFAANMASVDAEKHVQIMERLLGFIVPKPQTLDISVEYMELEQLLQKTPDEYIERISARILELNALSNTKKEEEHE